jgi:hypothetical protein
MDLISILLQEGPAETTNYMILGYSVIFGVLAIYLVSLYLRQRNLKRDVELLQELDQQEESGAQPVTSSPTSPSSVQNAH